MSAPGRTGADKARVLELLAPLGDTGLLLTDMQPEDESLAVGLMLAGDIDITGTPGILVNGARAVINAAGRARLQQSKAAA